MSFYDSAGASGVAAHIEVATLLEEILLPELPPFPTMEEIHSDRVYYPRTIELYEDMVGKFSIPILSPLGNNTGEPEEEDIISEARNIVNESHITVNPFQKSNYVELVIPKYILLNFLEVVPAGTRFIVCFIGDSLDIEDIKVIGLVREIGGEE